MNWQPMKTAPRVGTNILLRWGSDGVSQGKYIPGLPKPWQFIDTNDGITWLINHAVDNEYGPTHWMPMPPTSGVRVVDPTEAVARVIYDQWADQCGWVPWVERGNSTMQDEARSLARKALDGVKEIDR